VTIERVPFLASPSRPHFHSVILATGRQPLAVRTERDTRHFANVTFQSKEPLARGQVPDNCAVENSCDQTLAVRTESDAVDAGRKNGDSASGAEPKAASAFRREIGISVSL
jgi:hypothetical protein